QVLNMIELTPILVPTLSFAAVATVVLVLGHYLSIQAQMRRRLPAQPTPDMPVEQPLHGIDAFVVRHFGEARFGITAAVRDKLRRKLLDAGYFTRQAVSYYLFARVACLVVIPALVYLASELVAPSASPFLRLMLVSVALLIGAAAPDFYLVQRQRALAQRYRQVFPDLLDLLGVCVGGGRGRAAPLGRGAGGTGKPSPALGSPLPV